MEPFPDGVAVPGVDFGVFRRVQNGFSGKAEFCKKAPAS